MRYKGYSYWSLKFTKAKVKKDNPLGKFDPQQNRSSLSIDRLT